ncbi:MAG: beta-propeller fold lactonase family protein, partial [Cytophagales bacterium]
DFVFVVNELTANLELFRLENLNYRKLGVFSLLEDSSKKFSAADIHMSDDEKFLYVSNRGETNELVVFDLSQIDKPKRIQNISTGGKTPRNFTISPDGKWIFVANQNSHNITIFERNLSTGMLKPSGKEINIGLPTCLIWL